jgi:hypothetical protein
VTPAVVGLRTLTVTEVVAGAKFVSPLYCATKVRDPAVVIVTFPFAKNDGW